ncbi:MAG: Stp1/IreP family PP2C-type Ser/Thr phosphatase [Chlamydiia bacterium]|nr:Stp1/IreP family PP2C-type Ser/Thr phosphatase [Chlamydiia bacterium]
MYQAFGLSDIGGKRAHNEDEWIAIPELGFFALADGMGGHKAGDVAAQETIRFLCSMVRRIQTNDCVEWIIELRHAIETTNQKIYHLGQSNQAFHGMGTTLCCLCWKDSVIIYAHVGDSRIYRVRNGKLHQLTQDHSLFAKWLSVGKLAEECETPFPYKNVITRAVGTGKKANPEIAVTHHQKGDVYLLCSDGLTDMLSVEEMEEILSCSSQIKEGGEKLIQRAKFKGGYDNMTVLIVGKHGEDLFR